MIEVCEKLAFAAEPHFILGCDGAGFEGRHFQRDLLFGDQVPGAVDDPRAAAADLALDHEAAAHAASFTGGRRRHQRGG